MDRVTLSFMVENNVELATLFAPKIIVQMWDSGRTKISTYTAAGTRAGTYIYRSAHWLHLERDIPADKAATVE